MGIQLRILLASIIAFVASITAVVCFAPTYIVGVNSVLSTVDSLRANIVTLAGERLTAYVSKPRDLALMLEYASARGRLDVTNSTAMIQLACDLALNNPDSFSSVMFLIFELGMVVRCQASSNTASSVQNTSHSSVVLIVPGSMTAYLIDNKTNLPIPGSAYFTAPLPPNVPLWALGAGSTVLALNPMVNTVWSPPSLIWDSTSLEVSGRFNFANGTFRGAVMIDQLSLAITKFLQTLGLREGGRAIAWDDTTGIAISVSWNEPAVILLPSWQNQLLPVNQRAVFRQLDNFSDPLLQRVIASYGGIAALRALPVPFEGSIGGGKDLVYINTIGVNDTYGLNLKTLLMMPQIDFLRSVYQQQLQTIAGVCCGIAAMIAIAFAIGHLTAAPLRRLAERMELTASFQDNDDDDPKSALSEVASMQASYSLMKAQLNRAKTYLPQSVLAPMDQEDEEEEEEEPAKEAAAPVVNVTSQRPSRVVTSLEASANKSEGVRRSETGSSKSSLRRSHNSSNGRAVAVALNLELGLKPRCVSVVAFNLSGFMKTTVSSVRRCAEVQEILLRLLQAIVKEQKGVIDYFQGDRVLASFNAVTNTVGHGRRAMVAAMTAVRQLQENSEMPAHATAGLSSGMALCGNMGTSEMKRFCIVGYPVLQALTLERMTKIYRGIRVLMPGWLETDTSLDAYYQAVDIVRLPGGGTKLDASLNARQCTLLAPMSLKTAAMDEWMYELKAAEDADPFRHVNAGFKALLTGDIAAAQAALSERSPEAAALGLSNLASHIARAQSAGAVVPTDLGLYFNASMLNDEQQSAASA